MSRLPDCESLNKQPLKCGMARHSCEWKNNTCRRKTPRAMVRAQGGDEWAKTAEDRTRLEEQGYFCRNIHARYPRLGDICYKPTNRFRPKRLHFPVPVGKAEPLSMAEELELMEHFDRQEREQRRRFPEFFEEEEPEPLWLVKKRIAEKEEEHDRWLNEMYPRFQAIKNKGRDLRESREARKKARRDLRKSREERIRQRMQPHYRRMQRHSERMMSQPVRRNSGRWGIQGTLPPPPF